MKELIIASVCGIQMIFFALYASAATTGPQPSPGSTKLRNPLNGIETIEQLIPAILKIVVQLGVVVCTFFIIYAGFLYVTALGNEDKIKKAHSIFLYSVLGTMVLLGAQLIATLLGNTILNIVR